MKVKSLFLLIAIVLIAYAGYYYSSSTRQKPVDSSINLVPGLSGNLNAVKKFTVVEVGNALLSDVSKSDKGWVVNNRDGYEANIAAVRQMLTNLAEAKLIEAKTSNPDNYAKLGVEDVSNQNAKGILFSIEGLDQEHNIIIGNKGSSGKNTQYIRKKEEQQSWLINKKLNLNRNVTDWLQKDILDIPPERIKTIQIRHPDGSEVNIANDGEEEYEYTLEATAPEGMKISESEIYQVANALSSMQLRDVSTFAKLDTKSITPVETIFKTYDGLTITTKAYDIGINKYFTIEVKYSENDVDLKVTKGEATSTSPQDIISVDTAMKSDPKAAAELAESSQQRLAGWAYQFPSITQDALVKKLENFFIEKNAQ
jgi:hypothetical protein